MFTLSTYPRTWRRARGDGTDERGSSLIGILLVVMILGVMAAVTLGSLGYAPNSTMTGVPLTMPGGGPLAATTSTTAVNSGAGNIVGEATVAACRSDYANVEAAVHRFESLNGSPPPAGTAWASTTANGGPLLQSWPRGDHQYSIVWDGSTLSVVPAKGVAAHGSIGSNSPRTGCFAV